MAAWSTDPRSAAWLSLECRVARLVRRMARESELRYKMPVAPPAQLEGV